MTLTDALARPLSDLRISVTDRCSVRCVYYMPKEVFGQGYQFRAAVRLTAADRLQPVAKGRLACDSKARWISPPRAIACGRS